MLRRYFGKISPLPIESFVGKDGELVIDDVTGRVYVMDGINPGGIELGSNGGANLGALTINSQTITGTVTNGNIHINPNGTGNLVVGGNIYIGVGDFRIRKRIFNNESTMVLSSDTSSVTMRSANTFNYLHFDYVTGNIGINTELPAYRFDVQGDVRITDDLNVDRIYSNLIVTAGSGPEDREGYRFGTASETLGSLTYTLTEGRLKLINRGNVGIDITEEGRVNFPVGIQGNINPLFSDAYSLGNVSHQWKELWVGNNTIYIGGSALSIENGNITIDGNTVISGGANLGDFTIDGATLRSDAVTIQTTDGDLFLDADSDIIAKVRVNGFLQIQELEDESQAFVIRPTAGTITFPDGSVQTSAYTGGGNVSALVNGASTFELFANGQVKSSDIIFASNGVSVIDANGAVQGGIYSSGDADWFTIGASAGRGYKFYVNEEDVGPLFYANGDVSVPGTITAPVGNIGDVGLYGGTIYGTNPNWNYLTLASQVEGYSYVQIPADTYANIGNLSIHNDLGNVEIGTNAGSSLWYFGSDGNFYLPNNGDINLKGGSIRQMPDEDLYIRVSDVEDDGWSLHTVVDDGTNTFSSTKLSRSEFQIGTDLSGNYYTWQFDNAGRFNLAGDITGVYGGNSSFYTVDNGSGGMVEMKTISYIGDQLLANVTVRHPNVSISTQNAAYNWIFDGSGNLTIPGNINYANGTSILDGLGGAVTGNVTFNDLTIQGVGNEYGGGGLYLSPDSSLTANLMYFRVRGGDNPIHLHFDTGDGNTYDQYFGDDNKYFKLENGHAGNAIIGLNGNAGPITWTFGTDGNLQLPAGGDIVDSTGTSVLGGGNSFSIIAVAAQSSVVADSTSDTLTLVAGTNITLTTDASTDTITIAAASGGGAALEEPFESKITATGTVTHDCTTNRLFYHTSISANFTANFTNLGLAANEATSVTLVLVQGVTARMCNAVQIAGVNQTISWQGSASAPSGNASRTDVVTFSILCTATDTYTVLGMMTSFGGA